MPALGSTGPDKEFVAFGQTIDCMSGMAYLTGYLGEEPMLQSGISYGDPLSGMNAAFAIISALLNRKRTGAGMHIELSQVEGLIAFNADSVLDFSMNGRVRERIGNRDRTMAPQGCYRCKGIDRWIAITIPDNQSWIRFCHVIGVPAWAEDKRFVEADGRFTYHEEIDKVIQQWVINREDREVLNILQTAEIPAGPILDARDLLIDPQLNARGFFETISHPIAGAHPEIAAFAKFSKTPIHIQKPAPCLGQHNEFVLGELLGISTQEISKLTEMGVIGKKAVSQQQGGM